MRKGVYVSILLFCSYFVSAQNTFRAVVRNNDTKEVLKGASLSIPELKFFAVSDSSGLISVANIPNGKFEVRVSYLGFARWEKGLGFPLPQTGSRYEIGLEPQSGELEEITIQTTRTNQNLSDIPTRIEALPLEELEEKSTMKPGDIKMLLGEATGIMVQQTSAVSGTANFKIQGLGSRYTQLLKDGMPLYQGFSGGLSLLQISPLDLKQVEFIKGSASTLYGGGAIAGLVNLISKTPTQTPELTFLLNGTSAKGADASGFYSQKWKHFGTTVFTSYNYNGAYSPGGTGFTAIPQTKRVTISPKIFLYLGDKNSGWFGINATAENRLGGDVKVLSGKADNIHQYFEKNKSVRFSSQLSFTHKINSKSQFNIKNATGYFDRQFSKPAFNLNGKQLSSFSEVNYVNNGERNHWVAGANLITDDFKAPDSQSVLNYSGSALGAFVQNTYKANKWFSLESGIRADHSTQTGVNGFFVLPRVNALFKFDEHFTSRIGGGLGYKTPTLFSDEAEQEGYENIQPLNHNARSERSYGANGDINFRGAAGDAFLNINQMFFYTNINSPLILQNNLLVNANGFISTRGAETNIKWQMDELAFYLGYTYTDTRQHFNGQGSTQPLTPKNRISFDATYEIEGSFRFGAEGFYNGRQLLYDGTTGKQYITFGLLAQKMWKHLDVYVNAENLTDRRQSRWGAVYSGSISSPDFKDIYAPLDGVVVNAGIRLKVLN